MDCIQSFPFLNIYKQLSTMDLRKDSLLLRIESRVSYQLLPLKSAPYRHLFYVKGLPKCCDDFGRKWENSLSRIIKVLSVALDWMKVYMKSSYIFDIFFDSLVDTVGDQDMKSSFICIWPLRQILAFTLARSL